MTLLLLHKSMASTYGSGNSSIGNEVARQGHMAFGNPAEILGYAGHPPSIQGLLGRRDIPARTRKLPFLSGNVYYILQALTM